MTNLEQTLFFIMWLACVRQICGSEAINACVTITEKTPCRCEVTDSKMISVNCSFTNVTYIPNEIPGALTEKLNMSSTILCNLSTFNSKPFETFIRLTVLDLYNTALGLGNATLTDETFVGLTKLKYLDISNNDQVNITRASNEKIFAPFAKSLKELRMYATTGTYVQEYPSKILLKLSNLEELWLDGLTNMTFDVAFRNATKLKTLKIAGDKVIPPWRSSEFCETNITSQSFSNLIHLTSLSVTKCDVRFIEKNAFQNLTQLKHVDLSGNVRLGIEGFSKAASSLSDSLESLVLNEVENPPFMICGITIDVEHVEPLRRLKNLKYVSIRGNAINSITGKAFEALASVEEIDASRNEFEVGMFIFYTYKLSKVKKVDVSFNFFNSDISIWTSLSKKTNIKATPGPFAFGTEVRTKVNKLTTHINDMTRDDERFKEPPNNMKNEHAATEDSVAKKSPHINVCPMGDYFVPRCAVTGFLPPEVEEIDLSYSKIGIPAHEICLSPENNLKTLSMAGSLVYCFDGPVHGLEKLENIDLSKNFAGKISEVFFDGSPSLKQIILNENNLYDSLREVVPRLFLKTPLVETLEIASNHIEQLPSDTFTHLGNLVHLNLANNLLKEFNFDVSHMHKLKTIDISFNRVETINKETRAVLDSIAKAHTGNDTRIEINLRHNNIICSCSNLEFIKWLNEHFGSCSFLFVNITECYFFSEGTTKTKKFRTAADLQKEVDFLDGFCASYTWVIVVGVVVLFIFLMIVVGVIVHKFRWKIVYWYYVNSRRKRSPTSRAGYTSIGGVDEESLKYRFHFYLASTLEENEFAHGMAVDLRKKKYKVFIPNEDILPGSSLYGPIANAIHLSKTVLFLVSNGCEEDPNWRIALHLTHEEEATRRNRGMSVAVFRDRMPESGWSLNIIHMLRRCSLDYPTHGAGEEDEDAIEAFYRELIDKSEELDDTPLTHSVEIQPRHLNMTNN